MRFIFCATLQQKNSPLFFVNFMPNFQFLYAGDRQQTGFFFVVYRMPVFYALFFLKSYSANVKQSTATTHAAAAPEIFAFFTCPFLPARAAFDVIQVGVLSSGSLLSSIPLHLQRSRDISDLLEQPELISSEMKSASDCCRLERC